MIATCEIISDRVEAIATPDGRRRVRMLALRDCDAESPLQNGLDYILTDEQARRFARVFIRSGVGRVFKLAITAFHVTGFGARVRLDGVLLEVY